MRPTAQNFNTRIKELEAMRLQLATWKEAMSAFMSQVEHEYQPLVQAYLAHRRALVVLFDQAYQHRAMGKRDKVKLAGLICEMALGLLADGDDAELKEIYKRYGGGAADLRSPDAMPEASSAQMGRHAGQEQQSARPGPASVPAREQRQAAEADTLRQSLRDIFRRLVSKLHPDRSADAAERQRKTALMQRVNVAYAANDLLGLLALQLEIEPIDQAGLDKLSEERITQYSKILDEQLREIEREIAGIEYSAAMVMGGQTRTRLTPQTMLRALRVDIAETRAGLDAIVAQLEQFRDVKKLKAWLDTYQPAGGSGHAHGYWY